MTFEERMERIEVRHEALAQALEVLAGEQKKTEQLVQLMFEAQAETDRKLAQVMDAIGRLGNIAAIHEDRQDRLEGR